MNPDRLDAWRKMVAEQQGSARELLDGALNVAAKGGLLKAEASAPLPPTPGMNDWYWSGFFASGNPAYIQRLIDQLRYVDERQNLVLYMTGGSAEWSLASNARQHSRVRNILQEARQRVDARTAALIDELLQRDPQAIRAEMQQTARAIQAATQPH
jgi:DNA-binding transcriptional MerR regulator